MTHPQINSVPQSVQALVADERHLYLDSVRFKSNAIDNLNRAPISLLIDGCTVNL